MSVQIYVSMQKERLTSLLGRALIPQSGCIILP